MSNIVLYNKEQQSLLKATVAKGATDAELSMFCQFCESTKLNPFKKEIWFIKTGSQVQMMTGINGFLAIANNNPNFDGMEVEVEEKDGKPVSATAKVYRKDRRFPSVGVAYFSEYSKPTPIWRQMPRVMLTKVAKSIALREAFPQELNGLYTQEEMPKEYSIEAAQSVSIQEKAKQLEEVVDAQIEEDAYFYELTKLPKEKQGVAIAYANKENLKVVYVGDKIFTSSVKPVQKFSNCTCTRDDFDGEEFEQRIKDVSKDSTVQA